RQPGIVKKLASTGANLWPDSTAIHHEIIEMTQPAYTVLHEKVNRNDSEKTKWKLVRLLLDEPHISLSELNRITCPTLVIGGDHDVIKEEHTMLIYKNLPKAYLWILPNSGHKTLFTYKDEFNKTVDQFFSNPYKKIVGTERFK
ncbi:MAG: alpha/beta fold hydrolase, partial [Flavitalea sp.]